MARVSIAAHPLTATATLVRNGDLPRPLQRTPFDTADGVTPPPASSPAAAARPGQQYAAELISGGTPARAGSWNQPYRVASRRRVRPPYPGPTSLPYLRPDSANSAVSSGHPITTSRRWCRSARRCSAGRSSAA